MNKPVDSTLHITIRICLSTQPYTQHNVPSTQPYTLQHNMPVFSTLQAITQSSCHLKPTYNTLCPSSQPYAHHTVPIFSTLHTASVFSTPHCSRLLNPTHYNTLCLSSQPYTLQHTVLVFSTLHTTHCACLLNPTHNTHPCLLNPSH